jgi:NADPH2:quinone reductase
MLWRMRAAVCHELTGPSALRIDEIDAPEPAAGQVSIDVRAAGVNFPDVLITQGKYQFKPTPPFIPGGEVAGVVREVGEGVVGIAPGDRVAATMLFGAFAERVVVPATNVFPLPDAVDFDVGAATLVAYATTLHALVDRAHLREGETLLVLGAGGGVGLAAVELGKCLGARVIAAASSETKLERCRSRGADATVDYTREDLKARVKALAPGGVDVVYDPVGGDMTEAAIRTLGWEGRLLVVGFASGTIPKIPTNLMLLKNCQLVGVFWGAFTQRDPARNREHVATLMAWIAEGRVRPHIDAAIPLARAGEALERLARRDVTGKLVLVP